MNKKLITYLALTGFFLLLALHTSHKMDSGDRIDLYADRIEKGLHEHEKKVQNIMKDTDFFMRRLNASDQVANLADDSDLSKLEDLSAAPFSIVFSKNSEINFWTSNAAPSESIDFAQIPKSGEFTRLELSNGTYLGKRETIADEFFKDYDIYSFFPIKRVFNIESPYLEKQFTAEKYVPNAAMLISTPTDYPIKDLSGNVVSYLKASIESTDKTTLKRLAIFYGLFLIFLGTSINNISKYQSITLVNI